MPIMGGSLGSYMELSRPSSPFTKDYYGRISLYFQATLMFANPICKALCIPSIRRPSQVILHVTRVIPTHESPSGVDPKR